MNPNEIVTVSFMEIKWPSNSKPTILTKDIRMFFLENCIDDNKQIIDMSEAKDVLQAYLYDEHRECPEDFSFKVINKV